jgi:4-amino-4-deoxy-L-arabinose transferase-like glycosyltransferase
VASNRGLTKPSQCSLPSALGVWILAALAGLLAVTRDPSALLITLPDALALLALDAAMFSSGALLACLALRPLRPLPAGPLLKALTCILLGGWFLSGLTMALSLLGWLHAGTAWAIVALGPGGGLVWILRSRKALIPRLSGPPVHLSVGSVVLGALCAASVGIWLAGAMRPPWFVGLPGDGYDVTLYHLQVPREILQTGRMTPLWHNVYSFYPMQLEMQYLLGMALKGPRIEDGMYLAKILHGLHGYLAAATLLVAWPRMGRRAGRIAMTLLATSPFLLRLGWVAMVELGEFAYLALALAWLGRWWYRPRWKSALLVGAALACSCCVKYLSVGFIVAPVAVLMVLRLPGRDWTRRLGQAALALVVTVAMMSPWLIRNVAWTSNPVFPLATDLLGRGHWSPEAQQRWIQGHRPGKHPPVPLPAVQGPRRPKPSTAELFAKGLFDRLFNPVLVALAAAAGLWALWRWIYSRRSWPGLLSVFWLVQLALWALATHELPPRFLSPALVVMCVQVAEGLVRLTRSSRLLPCWSASVASLALAGLSLLLAVGVFEQTARGPMGYILPLGHDAIAREALPVVYDEVPPSGRVLLIGESPAFYYPPGTLYATPFDAQVLLEHLAVDQSPRRRLETLQRAGITHIRVNWAEIRRLATTYGYPAVLSDDVLLADRAGRAPTLSLLEQLKPLGMRVVAENIPPGRPADRRFSVSTLYALP